MNEQTNYILPHPDFEAVIYYLTAAEEGRTTEIATGYRGQFYYDNKDWDAAQQFLQKKYCQPGESVTVLMQTASPSNHTGKLFIDKIFEVREGNRTVGIGQITRIINEALRKQAEDAYERQVQQIIQADMRFALTQPHHVQNIKSIPFIPDEYPAIKLLLEQNRWWLVKQDRKVKMDFNEYLYIFSFRDKQDNHYLTSIYDSDELWQDPQIIDIFRVDNGSLGMDQK